MINELIGLPFARYYLVIARVVPYSSVVTKCSGDAPWAACGQQLKGLNDSQLRHANQDGPFIMAEVPRKGE